MSIFYALLLPQHVRLAINEARRVLFCSSGHPSFRAQQGWILLGETSDRALTKKVTCPTLPLTAKGKSAYASNTLFFPIEEKELKQIRTELGVSHPYSGIYLGELDIPYETEIPQVNNLRLALVEILKEGEITLWRTLAEKRLQRDTAF
ncbi:MAG: hypothetical protein RBR15_02310 [Sphaerochaeta sp.]|nr:hypothetical protein [Sphaerochaeta sp.]